MNKFKYVSTIGWLVVGIPTLLVLLMVIYSIKNYKPRTDFPSKAIKTISRTKAPEPVVEKAKEVTLPIIEKTIKQPIRKETKVDSAAINDTSSNKATPKETTSYYGSRICINIC